MGEWWTLLRVSHPKELLKLIGDTVNQEVGCGNLKSVEHPVDALSQVAEVAAHEVTEGRSDVQVKHVDFSDVGFFVHALSIGSQGCCWGSGGTVSRLSSGIVLCQTDQVRLLNDGRSEAVKGLTLITLHHDVFDQVAARGSDEGTTVGSEAVREDLDCVCFVHTGMMAQIQGNCKGLWTVQKVAQGGLWEVAEVLY